jgi:hypothetical protein
VPLLPKKPKKYPAGKPSVLVSLPEVTPALYSAGGKSQGALALAPHGKTVYSDGVNWKDLLTGEVWEPGKGYEVGAVVKSPEGALMKVVAEHELADEAVKKFGEKIAKLTKAYGAANQLIEKKVAEALGGSVAKLLGAPVGDAAYPPGKGDPAPGEVTLDWLKGIENQQELLKNLKAPSTGHDHLPAAHPGKVSFVGSAKPVKPVKMGELVTQLGYQEGKLIVGGEDWKGWDEGQMWASVPGVDEVGPATLAHLNEQVALQTEVDRPKLAQKMFEQIAPYEVEYHPQTMTYTLKPAHEDQSPHEFTAQWGGLLDLHGVWVATKYLIELPEDLDVGDMLYVVGVDLYEFDGAQFVSQTGGESLISGASEATL